MICFRVASLQMRSIISWTLSIKTKRCPSRIIFCVITITVADILPIISIFGEILLLTLLSPPIMPSVIDLMAAPYIGPCCVVTFVLWHVTSANNLVLYVQIWQRLGFGSMTCYTLLNTLKLGYWPVKYKSYWSTAAETVRGFWSSLRFHVNGHRHQWCIDQLKNVVENTSLLQILGRNCLLWIAFSPSSKLRSPHQGTARRE